MGILKGELITSEIVKVEPEKRRNYMLGKDVYSAITFSGDD
jgi:hypothetical protein